MVITRANPHPHRCSGARGFAAIAEESRSGEDFMNWLRAKIRKSAMFSPYNDRTNSTRLDFGEKETKRLLSLEELTRAIPGYLPGTSTLILAASTSPLAGRPRFFKTLVPASATRKLILFLTGQPSPVIVITRVRIDVAPDVSLKSRPSRVTAWGEPPFESVLGIRSNPGSTSESRFVFCRGFARFQSARLWSE